MNMITFDSSTLKRFFDENIEFLTNARLQKIQQPTRREFILTLRNMGMSKKLYINITPQFYHICFMSKENEEKRLIEIPKQPPMFCMLLRKYLENSRICKINQPKYERILEFYIETYNEISEKMYLCLAVELMGKHSNIILYNCDTSIIIGCAHNVGSEKSREREVLGGIPYIYPPHHSNDWYSGPSSLSLLQGNINNAIDEYFAQQIAHDKFVKMQDKYKQIIQKKLNKLENSIQKISCKHQTIEKTDTYRLWGDLIMANLYNNKDYVNSVNVFDYENNKNISIKLDNTKTLKENATYFYKLYNKSKNTNNKIIELTEQLKQDLQYNSQLLYSINRATSIKDLSEITFEIEPEKKVEKPLKTSIEPIKLTGENYIIWIGKNNKQNDYIISKLAKDEDYWFHTKDCAGSHVLLRCEKISNELILKCCNLAKENSSGAKSSKIGVIYTKAKYLKKPPKANLGYVIYSNEEEIIID